MVRARRARAADARDVPCWYENGRAPPRPRRRTRVDRQPGPAPGERQQLAAGPGQINRAQRAPDAPPLLQSRCRITWLCDHLAAGTRLDVIAAAGGFAHAEKDQTRSPGSSTPCAPDDAVATLRDAAPPG